jgi:peptidoglycan/xylan/chitin deacetylase (PgdA/CDA1 family)
MRKNNFISINLHLDSLGESYGWPDDFVNDNAFSVGLERIGKILKKFKIPITVFVVGKDLENKKNFDLIKKFINNIVKNFYIKCYLLKKLRNPL